MEAEAEAEAVDGKLKEAEAEAKEKLTAVPSLVEPHEDLAHSFHVLHFHFLVAKQQRCPCPS